MELDTRVERAAGAAPRGGKLRVGAHVPTVGGSKASIPSRFEVVLNADAREANGFGRRTFRFDEPINDLPGPGAYSKPRNITNKSQLTLSCSTKGSAAFAGGSRAPPVHSTYTPGPAAYSPEKPKAASAAGPSAAFHQPSEKRMLRVAAVAKPVPGPGAYRPEDYGREKPGGRMTTLGPRDVGPITQPPTAPGPGEFLPDSYINGFGATRMGNSRSAATAPAGRDASMKATAMAKSALPPALLPEVGSAGPLPSIVRETAVERQQRDLLQSVAGSLRPADPKPAGRSAAFADTTLDRFGVPTVRYTAHDDGNLGPGSYETDAGRGKQRRMLVSSPWALSTVERGERKPRYAVPGPAYYDSRAPPSKLSHHMVSKDYWA